MPATVRAVRRYGVKEFLELESVPGYGRYLHFVRAFTIGRLAEAAGVNVETVRYYERRGLLERPVRRGSEYREYSDVDVARLRFIRRAKTLGFTLTEIRELLPAADRRCTGDVLAAARAKLAIVEEAMAEQQAQRQRLVRLIDVCADGGDDCITLEIASG